MTNKFYPETYKCPICNTIQKHYVWSNEVVTKKHGCILVGCAYGNDREGYGQNTVGFNDIFKEIKPSVPGIRTDTKNRV